MGGTREKRRVERRRVGGREKGKMKGVGRKKEKGREVRNNGRES